ncbi:alpha/beta hydrolase [Kineosporia sp. NBRC 101731]|uniref:alpha/beta hydrolase n=1 Tax=Kineosporia sp. NBRC 101731 TaxID=3032199 RepID=UPI0024A4A36A|nr:alpha/beta hydrolase [Kineosporia sp. NBRC 101731]GLY29924.1 esterase [Kineosporia sp. NBRC 101731]
MPIIGPAPEFDPEVNVAWQPLAATQPASVTPDLIPFLRSQRSQLSPMTDEDLRCEGFFSVEDRSVPGPDGAPEISLLILRPTATTAPTGALYWIHGGGMILGDNRGGMGEALIAAREFNLAVVSVEYRLAPENPHPAPAEDCYAGLVWTTGHAGELGINPARIICAGGSAGGGLAAAVTLMARDRGGPALLGQMLLCPMLDDRNDSVSAQQMNGTGNWDRISNETGWEALLGPAHGDPDVSAYAAPARATDLSGLPPTFIDVGSAETFRDEDIAYAGAIWAAGGKAELHVWPGGIHGYAVLAPQARISQETVATRLNWLRRLLHPATTPLP